MIKGYIGIIWLLTSCILAFIILVYHQTDPTLYEPNPQSNHLLTDATLLTRNKSGTRCLKKVLIWWEAQSAHENHGYGGKEGLVNCANYKCSVLISYAEDFSLLADADIVIFHASFHTKIENYQMFQNRRSSDQIWIWQTWESPTRVLSFVRKPPPWFRFNLTMSYSSESDIQVPYGRYIPFENPKQLPANSTNWLRGKTKSIAWVARNCRYTTWKRFEFVKYLQTRLPIDIFGSCGNLTCPGWNEPCKILKKYKFFLAFENSQCRDYITEKFWSWSFLYGLNLVPIVYGTSKEDYAKVAPPNSFIHISDFRSLDQFVKHIQLVENDVRLYNKYFEWKQKGRVVKGNDNFTPSRICSILHIQPSKKSHNIFREWWNGTCVTNTETFSNT